MTDERYRLGTGRYRLGAGQSRLQVRVDQRQSDALSRLRLLGVGKSEAVELALDLLLALPSDEIARRIRDRRDRII